MPSFMFFLYFFYWPMLGTMWSESLVSHFQEMINCIITHQWTCLNTHGKLNCVGQVPWLCIPTLQMGTLRHTMRSHLLVLRKLQWFSYGILCHLVFSPEGLSQSHGKVTKLEMFCLGNDGVLTSICFFFKELDVQISEIGYLENCVLGNPTIQWMPLLCIRHLFFFQIF